MFHAVKLLAITTRFLAVTAVCVLLCCDHLHAQDKPKTQPLRALMIAGGCCHDYPRQVEIVTQGVSQRANVTLNKISR